MEIGEALNRVLGSYPGDVGRFYAPGTALALGKGMIRQRAVFAYFDIESMSYRTAEGLAYILTHECDIDESNRRLFNEDILVCPLMPLEHLVEELAETQTEEQLASFLTNLGARNISRLIFLPPNDCCPNGCVMFLNQITNARTEVLSQRSELVCAVTAFGLAEIEYALENHILRPKADRLALEA